MSLNVLLVSRRAYKNAAVWWETVEPCLCWPSFDEADRPQRSPDMNVKRRANIFSHGPGANCKRGTGSRTQRKCRSSLLFPAHQ